MKFKKPSSLTYLVQFQVSLLDVADPVECNQIIMQAEQMAPVGGIFHLAMTLNDKLLSNQVSLPAIDESECCVQRE